MSSDCHAAAERGAASATCFSIHACAEPGVMPRVLELFAKRGLVPQRWHSVIGDPEESALTIDIEVGGLCRDTVEYVANCMRAICGVACVRTAQTRAG